MFLAKSLEVMLKKLLFGTTKRNSSIDLEVVIDIIRKLNGKYKRKTLTTETTFDSLGFTSMMYIEFFIKVEEATEVSLTTIASRVNLVRINTIGEFAKVLKTLKTVKFE